MGNFSCDTLHMRIQWHCFEVILSELACIQMCLCAPLGSCFQRPLHGPAHHGHSSAHHVRLMASAEQWKKQCEDKEGGLCQ